ncbi:unnamed protein product [Urochloa decumbens]|uniref:F-box domain-containing protein n=1 Tax=Urochloa decumbens TaxID=240449 RepID=A0ABC9DAX9_9POAL
MESTMMGGEKRDLLSELPDGILGHILSFLPSEEAGRAAVLSRRWRDVFAIVHTISFEQPEGERELTQLDDDEFYEAHDMTSPNADFTHQVAAALLSRRRSAGRVDVPLRRLRVSMFRYADWDSVMVDNCLNYALRSATGDEFHLDLRLCGVSTCRRDNGDGYYDTQEEEDDSSCDEVDDIDGTDIVGSNGNGHTENYNVVHGGWGSGVEDGMDGTNVVGDNANEYNDDDSYDEDDDSDGTDMVGGDGNEHMENDNIAHGGWGWGVEEGIDGMNMVGGNANEHSENESDGSDGPDGLGLGWGIYHVPRIVFRFVALRTLCLQMFSFDDDAHIDLPFVETLYLSKTFEPWTGIQRLISGCPRLTDLTLEECWTIKEVSITDVKLSRIICCDIDFCGKEPCRKEELLSLRKFLMAFVGSQRLHLSSARLGCHIESNSFSGFPNFYNLRHLELKGCLLDDLIVDAVTKVLEQTPNLEALSLYMSPKIISGNGHELEYDTNLVPNIPNVSAACLQYRLRQINLVHYQGSIAQRIVAKWLLQNAAVLNKLCVVFPKGPLWLQEMLIRETRGWSMNQSVNMLFI